MTNIPVEKLELVVVFKKNIELVNAKEILDNGKVICREGMDSGRGKLYYYRTGPKFILTFEKEADKQRILTQFEALPEIHEVYTPDWDKCKD
ncbi:hypothetical protein [Niastella populi]|uniref:Uncharacterized protein n=1 Tax=Niastella populi TaxID=550983 RepID=A0A1V9F586_9BACT|nr:hypothetical protein [Niastella populi]OQP53514.1 hypothetical protein A4R26_05895 [Niastella populi]